MVSMDYLVWTEHTCLMSKLLHRSEPDSYARQVLEEQLEEHMGWYRQGGQGAVNQGGAPGRRRQGHPQGGREEGHDVPPPQADQRGDGALLQDGAAKE